MTIASGSCGTNLTYVLNDDYSLVISGTGAMNDYSTSSSNRPPWYDYHAQIISVSLPSGLTIIGQYVFVNCSGLTSVTIPDSVTTIRDGAFYLCSGLTSITIPSSVTTIGSSAFTYCSGLTSVTIPDSVTTIRDGAFSNCSGLTSVTIPDSVTTIETGVFYNCSGLTSVIIPDSVTTLKLNAFSQCRSLTSITIPGSVTTIGNQAFSYCRSLTSITIPDSVTTIGNYAFSGCSSLTSITFLRSSSTGMSFGTYSFALGESSNPVTATVCSPNNWASSVLDGYKNNYTTFNYTAPPTMVFTISSNDGQTTLGTYTYTTISETIVTTVSSPAAVDLVRGSDVVSIPITPPTGKTFFGLTSTPNDTTTDISDISGTSTTVSTEGTYTYYVVFGSVINYFKYNGTPILVDRGICDEDGNDITTVYAKKTDVPNVTVSQNAPSNPSEGDIWIQY